MKYVKKPVVIDAVQLLWSTWSEVCDLLEGQSLKARGCFIDSQGQAVTKGMSDTGEMGLLIPTLEGEMLAREGDWIIKGVKGELYPCKPDIFELTYELV